MPRDRRDVEGGLLQKGFRQKEGDHHYFIYYSVAGKKTQVFTKTSHSEKEIDDGLLGMMARQCRITKKLFESLVDCPLSRQQYEDALRSRQILS